ELAEEWEDRIANHFQHALGVLDLAKRRPADEGKIRLLRGRLRVDALEGLLEPGGASLLHRFGLVEQTTEDEVGNLLDHGERVGDPADVKFEPELIDLFPKRAGDAGMIVHCALAPVGPSVWNEPTSCSSSSSCTSSRKTPSTPSAWSLVNGSSQSRSAWIEP